MQCLSYVRLTIASDRLGGIHRFRAPAMGMGADIGCQLRADHPMAHFVERLISVFSHVTREITTATKNDNGMQTMAGLRRGTNHQASAICASVLPNASTCTVGER